MAQTTRKIAKARQTAMGIEYKTTVGDKIFMVFDVLFFSLFAFICIFPFYYILINTISDNSLVNSGAITLVPQGIHFSNYISLLSVSDFINSIGVTISRTILGTALMVLASAFAGYLTTKHRMWHRSLWYRVLVITMYFNAGLIPTYLNMMGLGLTDNYLGYILPGIVAPYNIILTKTYIESIPGELQESAYIDGASTMQVFTKIILPLAKPILATIAVFGAVANWNSFQDSLIYMANSPELVMQIINWLYTPEGMMTNNAGLRGLMWDYDENGNTVLTDVGLACMSDGSYDLSGTEWTSPYTGETYTLNNTYVDGSCQWNSQTMSPYVNNPDSVEGETFSKKTWTSYIDATMDYDIVHDWQETTGYETQQAYLADQAYNIKPAAANNFIMDEGSTELKLVVEQVSGSINKYSWQAIYAASDAEFDSIIDTMQSECAAYGYDQILEWYRGQAEILAETIAVG